MGSLTEAIDNGNYGGNMTARIQTLTPGMNQVLRLPIDADLGKTAHSSS